ncbi:MAG TPA: 6,7-dimethyl-8-ribityllumazine synthase [Gammaproteobacteria bacterium]|jgi:6,7-dimethyl-8-ribityllumazine synthase|nr:6,7-dimethyl-8-ribityllumazine synthase [Gammaproteobacteria bacterium]
MQENCFCIAIVVSRFNQEITQKLLDSAYQRLQELQYDMNKVKTVLVPGAIEIPITAKRLASTMRYDAIICLGAVVLGETKHFDYVCQQVSFGCQEVALTHNIPVIFGVLTTDTEEQAFARTEVGRYSVDTAMELLTTLNQI